MPHIGKLDRKGLLIAAAVVVVGLGCWFLLREKPRAVAESEWDNIVFPEMAHPTVTDFAREPLTLPVKAAPVAPEPVDPEPRGMRVEMVANAPLELGHEWEPARIQESPDRDASRETEPARLGRGIEPAGATRN